MVSSGAENALKVETDLLRANPESSPALLFKHATKKKKDESVADFRAHLEVSSTGFLIYPRDEVTQPVSAATLLFVNSLCPRS